jgi:hypothetical protein
MRSRLMKGVLGWLLLAFVLVCVVGVDLSGRASGMSGVKSPFCRKRVNVTERKLAAKIVTSRPSYSAGSEVIFRVDNIGTVSIGLIGEEFVIENYDGSQWVRNQATPNGFPKIRLGFLDSGQSGFCRSFQIPGDVAAGNYRVRKEVLGGQHHRRIRLMAAFGVE